MTNKKLRQKARKDKKIGISIDDQKEDNSNISELTIDKPLKQLGDLSRTTEKKTKDKVRKNNREDKFISLGL